MAESFSVIFDPTLDSHLEQMIQLYDAYFTTLGQHMGEGNLEVAVVKSFAKRQQQNIKLTFSVNENGGIPSISEEYTHEISNYNGRPINLQRAVRQKQPDPPREYTPAPTPGTRTVSQTPISTRHSASSLKSTNPRQPSSQTLAYRPKPENNVPGRSGCGPIAYILTGAVVLTVAYLSYMSIWWIGGINPWTGQEYPTKTPTFTPTSTPTHTPTITLTPTNTLTPTPTNTPTITPTFTPSLTPTITLTPTPLPTLQSWFGGTVLLPIDQCVAKLDVHTHLIGPDTSYGINLDMTVAQALDTVSSKLGMLPTDSFLRLNSANEKLTKDGLDPNSILLRDLPNYFEPMKKLCEYKADEISYNPPTSIVTATSTSVMLKANVMALGYAALMFTPLSLPIMIAREARRYQSSIEMVYYLAKSEVNDASAYLKDKVTTYSNQIKSFVSDSIKQAEIYLNNVGETTKYSSHNFPLHPLTNVL